MHWALFSTLIYLGVMMPQSGTLFCDMIFNQFGTEMIKQEAVAKRANYRLLMQKLEARALQQSSYQAIESQPASHR